MNNLVLILATLGALLGGCAETPPAQPQPLPPTLVDVQLKGAANLNADAEGAAAPVMLRIYELRDASAFAGADFFAVFDREQGTLAADLLRKQEMLLKPGEERTVKLEPAAETRYLGFFAAFRQLDSAQWRVVVPIAAHQSHRFNAALIDNRLAVEPK